MKLFIFSYKCKASKSQILYFEPDRFYLPRLF